MYRVGSRGRHFERLLNLGPKSCLSGTSCQLANSATRCKLNPALILEHLSQLKQVLTRILATGASIIDKPVNHTSNPITIPYSNSNRNPINGFNTTYTQVLKSNVDFQFLIFDAMNFKHFSEMLEFDLQDFQKMLEIRCIKNAIN